MKEFLKELGITEPGQETPGGNYVIDFVDDEDSGENPNARTGEDKWASAKSKLDNSDLELDDDSSRVTEDSCQLIYYNDDYTVTMIQSLNFALSSDTEDEVDDGDTLQLVVRKN